MVYYLTLIGVRSCVYANHKKQRNKGPIKMDMSINYAILCNTVMAVMAILKQ